MKTPHPFHCLAVALLAALSAASGALGAEVSVADASRAAKTWVERGLSMGKLQAGRAVAGVDDLEDPSSGARLRVVRFEGGGFVVLSTDDRVDPVIAFSEGGEGIDPDGENPFWTLLRGDIAAREAAAGVVRGKTAQAKASVEGQTAAPSGEARRKWTELLAETDGSAGARPRAMQGVSSVSEIRVEPFVKSKWNQLNVVVSGKNTPCYNYYTPNNYYCGCVATAISQIMRYWKYPSRPVAVRTYPCQVSGVSKKMTMKGGTYDWDSMPLVPKTEPNLTEAQRRAIGKICYDVGVTVETSWAAGSSAASLYAGAACLPIDFGYASAKCAVVGSSIFIDQKRTAQAGSGKARGFADQGLLEQILVPNLDARCPCAMALKRAGNGHAVLVDGYGYSGGDFYLHLNLGWGGWDDAWYCPPAFGTSSFAYDTIDGYLFNIFPTNSGSIASGRVLDMSGRPIAGATVTLLQGASFAGSAVSDANGIYAFIADPGEYVVRAEKGGMVSEAAVSVGETIGTEIETAAGNRGSYYLGIGEIGNTCGNDIVLAVKVTFNAAGGTCATATKAYDPGKAYGALPGASWDGHAFLGWFTAASGGTRVTAQSIVEGGQNRTLYAHWETAEDPLKVWRFYSEKNKGHFFTISEAEKTQLLTTSPTWTFQGGAYRACKAKAEGTVPLYRFYSEKYKGHFFTRSEAEKDSLVATSKTWKYQGIAFYVYPNAAEGRIPVYRFWSDAYGHHFYTASEAEKDSLVATSKTWKYQGIAFWALPLNAATVTFDAAGGTCGTATKTYVPGKAYGALPGASWDGHAFLGWFTAASGGTQVTAQSIVEGAQSRTLYAHWEGAQEPLKVWRFYSEKNKGHFFTISEAEKTQLLTTSPTWTFQGGAYRAYKTRVAGTVPLYRFYSERYKGHFFTRSEAEKDSLVATSKSWKYQGIAYYVYPAAASGRIPVYRFWSDAYGHHFYTASETEKNNLVATSKTWKYQGIAFWALPTSAARGAGKRAMRAEGKGSVVGGEQPKAAERAEGGASGLNEDVRLSEKLPDMEVTTSDGTDGSAAADGDEGTAWVPERPEAGSWLVLTFDEPLEVAEVAVVGENLPEGMRVLLSEDAETWFEGEGGTAQYVWVAFPEGADGIKVSEVRVAEERE